MPRPRNATPRRHLHITIPEDIGAKLELHLYSEAEQRVPYQAWQRFFEARIKEFFESQKLDLALYVPDLPPGSFIYGPSAYIERLKHVLS